MTVFKQRLDDAAKRVEARLSAVLSAEADRGTPPRLIAAMRHAVLGGGKRFRPFLVLECAALFGSSPEAAIEAAAAIECIHCYSLVHDDLPSMDNDELRRGQPTVWKAYDEWTAMLVGDALQALAFEILAREACHPDANVRNALVVILAKASGAIGMVGGQALDLEAERLKPDWIGRIESIAALHRMKTGALITASAEMGAVLGGADRPSRQAIARYGDALGLAFQISDDLLDAESVSETAGKATGKDVAAGKATYVSALGISGARDRLAAAIAGALEALSPFGARGDVLRDAARFMSGRNA